MEKLQLAVMFGGRACEHDVSIITALQCMAAVDPQQYDVIPVYIARDGAWYTGEKLKDLKVLHDLYSGKTLPVEDGAIRLHLEVGEGLILQ